MDSIHTLFVMAGHSPSKTGVNALMPGHPRLSYSRQDVDARHKAGHDGVRDYFATVRSNWRSIVLPRDTAASSASFALFLPASAASISSDHTSRSCTMLPRRSPREFSVGSLLVSSKSGVSRYGFSL